MYVNIAASVELWRVGVIHYGGFGSTFHCLSCERRSRIDLRLRLRGDGVAKYKVQVRVRYRKSERPEVHSVTSEFQHPPPPS